MKRLVLLALAKLLVCGDGVLDRIGLASRIQPHRKHWQNIIWLRMKHCVERVFSCILLEEWPQHSEAEPVTEGHPSLLVHLQ